MAFLERRRFNFFNINHNVDSNIISQTIGDSKITTTSSGHGHLVICNDDGLIHLITRTFQVTKFQAYQSVVHLSTQLQYSSFLVTIGKDEPDTNFILKVWDLERTDRQSNPICVRSTKLFKSERPTTLCANDNRLLMAVGFVDGCIALYWGDLARDRKSKLKVLKDLDQEITGMAFKSVNDNQWYLFVSTASSVQQFNVTSKDHCPMTVLDAIGCDFKCSALGNGSDGHFMIAKEDAIYCYTIDGRGSCYAAGGQKIILQWFGGYLIIVSKESKDSSKAITISTTMRQFEETESLSITVLDIQNKFIVFSATIRDVLSILFEWGSLYILTTKGCLSQLVEKDLQSKLNELFKKNLYDVAVRIAQKYDSQAVFDIYRQYGDYLYAKSDHSGAVQQYIKTIGMLGPSYVIKKFLDSQQIESLTTYLHALHKSGHATKNHTTLLFNCYSKLNSIDKLQEFIITKDKNIDFEIDLEVAIKVCRQSSPTKALALAEKHNRHSTYIQILQEDRHEYIAALEYIEKLPIDQAVQKFKKYSNVFMENVPKPSVNFLKKICSNCYTKTNDLSSNSAQPEDFIYLLLNDSQCLVDFLEHFESHLSKWSTSLLNTYIEHCLVVWKNEEDEIKRSTMEKKIINILQSVDTKACDHHQILILATSFEFKPAIVHIFTHTKQYTKLVHYYLSLNDYSEAIECCRRYGHAVPKLWVSIFNVAMSDEKFPPFMLEEILKEIEKKSLLSAHFTITSLSKSKVVNIGHVRAYLTSLFGAEKKILDKEKEIVEEHQKETEALKANLQKLKNRAVVFQGSRCSASGCRNQLELPSVHFMCQHSYHLHCFQSFSDRENDCLECTEKNNEIMNIIRAQGQIKNLNEAFHSQLERVNDSFSLISEYFSRCLFDDSSSVVSQPETLKSVSPVPILAAIQTVPLKVNPILPKTDVQHYVNPFEDDNDRTEYDANKNPFNDEYDDSKNPFANDSE